MNAAVSQSFVLRAHLLWWNDDPFFEGQSAQESHPDGAMAVNTDGRIAWAGDASNLPADYADWPVVDPERAMEDVQNIEWKPEAKRKVLRTNALNLYKL